MKLKGKKISEVSQRFDLTGKELLPFAQDGENGSMSIDTIASYAYDKEGGDFTSRLAYDVHVPGVELIADRAEKDAFGNIITNTYLTRSGAKKAMNEVIKEQLPDAIANINDGFVTPNMLSEETKQLFGAETITNFPDNEDIAVNASNQLTLADKEYNPTTYSGMGRKKLRKNMINGVNTLTQNMLNKQNTMYVIQYDFDLNGEEITIPEGCVLDFQGGGFSNGKLILANTLLIGIPFFNCSVDGVCKNDIIEYDWFTSKKIESFKDAINLAKSSSRPLNVSKGVYNFELKEAIYCCSSISFNNSIINFDIVANGAMFRTKGGEEVEIENSDLQEIQSAINAKLRTSDVYKKYKNCLLKLYSNEIESYRSDNNTPINKLEYIYIDKEGYYEGHLENDSIILNSGIAIKYDDPVNVKDVIFNFINKQEQKQNLSIGVRFGHSYNSDINNIQLNFIGFTECSFIGMLGTSNDCFCRFNNISVSHDAPSLPNVTSYYMYAEYGILNVYNNLRLQGHNKNSWGATGMNYVYGNSYYNFVGSRLDCHYRLWDLNIDNSYIARLGLSYSGGGTINVTNTKFDGQRMLRCRTDYGSYFNGVINLVNCTLENDFADLEILSANGVITDVDWNRKINYLCCKVLNIKNLYINSINNDKCTVFKPILAAGNRLYKYTPPKINIDGLYMNGLYCNLFESEFSIFNDVFEEDLVMNVRNAYLGNQICNGLAFDLLSGTPTYTPSEKYQHIPIYNVENSECMNSSMFYKAKVQIRNSVIKSSSYYYGAYSFRNELTSVNNKYELHVGDSYTQMKLQSPTQTTGCFINCYFDVIKSYMDDIDLRYTPVYGNQTAKTIIYNNDLPKFFLNNTYNKEIEENVSGFDFNLSKIMIAYSNNIDTIDEAFLYNTDLNLSHTTYIRHNKLINRVGKEWINSDGTLSANVTLI